MNTNIENLCHLVKLAALKDLSTFGNIDKKLLSYHDLPEAPFGVRAHNMGIIVTNNEKLNFQLHIYYNPFDINPEFLAQFSQNYSKKHHPEVCKEFIKELGNLIAGKVCILYSSKNIDLNLSVPWITRGFDEIFNDTSKKQILHSFRWKILGPFGELEFLMTAESQDSNLLQLFEENTLSTYLDD